MLAIHDTCIAVDLHRRSNDRHIKIYRASLLWYCTCAEIEAAFFVPFHLYFVGIPPPPLLGLFFPSLGAYPCRLRAVLSRNQKAAKIVIVRWTVVSTHTPAFFLFLPTGMGYSQGSWFGPISSGNNRSESPRIPLRRRACHRWNYHHVEDHPNAQNPALDSLRRILVSFVDPKDFFGPRSLFFLLGS